MTDVNFIATYFPELSEIPQDTLTSARQRIVDYLKTDFPDLDTRPGSVFGDLGVSPFAHLLAAHEIATGRFMSDLDLENVANGVVYNCDFVRNYMGNFAVVDRDNLFSTGVVRVVYCSNSNFTLDRRARFSFGGDATFTMRLPNSGHFEVKSTGSSLTPGTNAGILSQISTDKWAVDIGVVGSMSSVVAKGTTGSSDIVSDDISSIIAAVDFTLGLPDTSLAKLAEKTRSTFFSASLNTRNGARHFLFKEFPEIKAVSPVINSDTEQVREVSSPLGAANGKADIFLKSNYFPTADTQTITLKLYNPVPSEGNPSRFIGEVSFLNPPAFIDSITSSTQPLIGLNYKVDTPKTIIISQTSDYDKAPLLQSAYSKYEKYYLCVEMPLSGSTPLLTTSVVGGEQYHNFNITYRADPVLNTVASVVESSDVAPIGVDVLSKGPVLVVLDSLTISYVKKPGVTMALETARTEIYEYFRTLGYPEVYSDSFVIDSMYYAGASSVTAITPSGSVQWTVADHILPESFTDSPLDDWNATVTAALTPPTNSVSTSSALTLSYTDVNIGTSSETLAVIGKRNVGYLLDKDDIVFTEVIT